MSSILKMDGLSLSLSSTPAAKTYRNSSVFRFSVPSFPNVRHSSSNLSFRLNARKFTVFASNNENELDSWDLMELKFGKMIGEDPKLTLAKIKGRKLNPELSYLEIEKLYNKKGGAGINEIEEVPFDVSEVRKSNKSSNSTNGLNLVRPVPKKGVKFEISDKPLPPKVKRPSPPVAKAVDAPRRSIPNVILRKPTTFTEDDEKSPRLSIKPNLSLKMGNGQEIERFSDMTLVRKPEPFLKNDEEPSGKEAEATITIEEDGMEGVSVASGTSTDVSLLHKPDMVNLNVNTDREPEASRDRGGSSSGDCGTVNRLKSADSTAEMGNIPKINLDLSHKTGDASKFQNYGQDNDLLTASETDLANSNSRISIDAALQGKPERIYQSVEARTNINEEVRGLKNPESYGNAVENDSLRAAPIFKEHEDTDWRRAEDLIKTGGSEEVEIISSSTRGFVVSFGSLIGFLPYRNLATKWKYLAFESWLRRKGLDPSMYRQNRSTIGSYEAETKTTSPDLDGNPQNVSKMEGEISPDMKLEDLLVIYDQEKLKYLSSFVGQKIKVNVFLADRESRRLIVSVKPKEKEESIEKKRSLMAKLSIGDVVKCCIKKITYFGIFVEVEGVPALIHQTEVSWDATLDPALYFKIGQVVEAKVHQLDYSLERIFLSLKEITPDPLIEALEAVVGDQAYLDGRLEAAQADTEWADVESLIKELKQYEGVRSVSKGRYFLSPGLAPTFQVYMASMFEDQYKLLARSENRVQEVIVQTSLSKEEMKSAILTCTNRVQ